MNQFNNEERQAGVLILSNLKMFNEAQVYFTEYIDPAFWQGFDSCVERFIKDKGWTGEANFKENAYCKLAQPDWDSESNKCYYEITDTGTEENYYLAIMCNMGTEQGRLGFQFYLDNKYFGGINKIKKSTHSIQRYSNQLKSLGFIDQGKCSYFIPIILDANLLAECWKENGSFPENHEVFSPLKDVLEKLYKSAEIIDNICATLLADNEDE